jgi:hypothetical protein
MQHFSPFLRLGRKRWLDISILTLRRTIYAALQLVLQRMDIGVVFNDFFSAVFGLSNSAAQ